MTSYWTNRQTYTKDYLTDKYSISFNSVAKINPYLIAALHLQRAIDFTYRCRVPVKDLHSLIPKLLDANYSTYKHACQQFKSKALHHGGHIRIEIDIEGICQFIFGDAHMTKDVDEFVYYYVMKSFY